jgi:hypothetical protein
MICTGKRMCTCQYYPQRGLATDFLIPVASLNDWPTALATLSNLIKSWETPIASQSPTLGATVAHPAKFAEPRPR